MKHSLVALLTLLPLLASAPAPAQVLSAPLPARDAAGPVRSVAQQPLQPRLPHGGRAYLAPDASSRRATGFATDRPRLYYSAPLSALFGVGGMLIGYGLGLGAFGCQDESPGCDTGPDDFEYTLGFTGLALGAATGAHRGGRTRESTGSFWASLGGAAIGALPLLLMRKDDDQTAALLVGMVAAPAGAVAADYFVRSPRNDHLPHM